MNLSKSILIACAVLSVVQPILAKEPTDIIRKAAQRSRQQLVHP